MSEPTRPSCFGVTGRFTIPWRGTRRSKARAWWASARSWPPGDVHEYNSFCVLEGRSGHMEGFYHFRREDGSIFRATIPRFHLRVPRVGESREPD